MANKSKIESGYIADSELTGVLGTKDVKAAGSRVSRVEDSTARTALENVLIGVGSVAEGDVKILEAIKQLRNSLDSIEAAVTKRRYCGSARPPAELFADFAWHVQNRNNNLAFLQDKVARYQTITK